MVNSVEFNYFNQNKDILLNRKSAQRSSLRNIKNWQPFNQQQEDIINNFKVKDDFLISHRASGDRAASNGIVRRMASSISNQLLNQNKSNSNNNQPARPISSLVNNIANKFKCSTQTKNDLLLYSHVDHYKVLKSESASSNTRAVSSACQLDNTDTSSSSDTSNSINFKGNFRVEETENGIQIQIKQPHLISVTSNGTTIENNNNNNFESNNNISLSSCTTNKINKTSIKIYPLKLGRTTIGSSQSNDIVLNGPGIEEEHCFIENNLIILTNNKNDNKSNISNNIDSKQDKIKGLSGKKTIESRKKKSKKIPTGNLVSLFPIARLCAVDGVLIENPFKLNSGSMICLGESLYFRYNNPDEENYVDDNDDNISTNNTDEFDECYETNMKYVNDEQTTNDTELLSKKNSVVKLASKIMDKHYRDAFLNQNDESFDVSNLKTNSASDQSNKNEIDHKQLISKDKKSSKVRFNLPVKLNEITKNNNDDINRSDYDDNYYENNSNDLKTRAKLIDKNNRNSNNQELAVNFNKNSSLASVANNHNHNTSITKQELLNQRVKSESVQNKLSLINKSIKIEEQEQEKQQQITKTTITTEDIDSNNNNNKPSKRSSPSKTFLSKLNKFELLSRGINLIDNLDESSISSTSTITSSNSSSSTINCSTKTNLNTKSINDIEQNKSQVSSKNSNNEDNRTKIKTSNKNNKNINEQMLRYQQQNKSSAMPANKSEYLQLRDVKSKSFGCEKELNLNSYCIPSNQSQPNQNNRKNKHKQRNHKSHKEKSVKNNQQQQQAQQQVQPSVIPVINPTNPLLSIEDNLNYIDDEDVSTTDIVRKNAANSDEDEDDERTQSTASTTSSSNINSNSSDVRRQGLSSTDDEEDDYDDNVIYEGDSDEINDEFLNDLDEDSNNFNCTTNHSQCSEYTNRAAVESGIFDLKCRSAPASPTRSLSPNNPRSMAQNLNTRNFTNNRNGNANIQTQINNKGTNNKNSSFIYDMNLYNDKNFILLNNQEEFQRQQNRLKKQQQQNLKNTFKNFNGNSNTSNNNHHNNNNSSSINSSTSSLNNIMELKLEPLIIEEDKDDKLLKLKQHHHHQKIEDIIENHEILLINHDETNNEKDNGNNNNNKNELLVSSSSSSSTSSAATSPLSAKIASSSNNNNNNINDTNNDDISNKIIKSNICDQVLSSSSSNSSSSSINTNCVSSSSNNIVQINDNNNNNNKNINDIIINNSSSTSSSSTSPLTSCSSTSCETEQNKAGQELSSFSASTNNSSPISPISFKDNKNSDSNTTPATTTIKNNNSSLLIATINNINDKKEDLKQLDKEEDLILDDKNDDKVPIKMSFNELNYDDINDQNENANDCNKNMLNQVDYDLNNENITATTTTTNEYEVDDPDETNSQELSSSSSLTTTTTTSNLLQLSESQYYLKDNYEKAKRERQLEQEQAELEKKRLQEILDICMEFQRQEQAKSQNQTPTKQNQMKPKQQVVNTLIQNSSTNSSISSNNSSSSTTSSSSNNQQSNTNEVPLISNNSTIGSSASSTSSTSSSSSSYMSSNKDQKLRSNDNLILPSLSTIINNVTVANQSSSSNKNKLNNNNNNQFQNCNTRPLTQQQQSSNTDILYNLQHQQQQQKQQQQNNHQQLNNNTSNNGNRAQIDKVTREKCELITSLNYLKQKIQEIEMRQNEAIRDLEMERALLDVEHNNELKNIQNDEAKLKHLQQEHQLRLEAFNMHTLQIRNEIEMLQMTMKNIENEILILDTTLDSNYGNLTNPAALSGINGITGGNLSTAHLANLKAQKEHSLEEAKRAHEDLEFQLMELEAKYETELEDIQNRLIKEQDNLLNAFKQRQVNLNDYDKQQTQMLMQVKAETECLELERQNLIEQFKKQRNQLQLIEKKLSKLQQDQLDGQSNQALDNQPSLPSPLSPQLSNDNQNDINQQETTSSASSSISLSSATTSTETPNQMNSNTNNLTQNNKDNLHQNLKSNFSSPPSSPLMYPSNNHHHHQHQTLTPNRYIPPLNNSNRYLNAYNLNHTLQQQHQQTPIVLNNTLQHSFHHHQMQNHQFNQLNQTAQKSTCNKKQLSQSFRDILENTLLINGLDESALKNTRNNTSNLIYTLNKATASVNHANNNYNPNCPPAAKLGTLPSILLNNQINSPTAISTTTALTVSNTGNKVKCLNKSTGSLNGSATTLLQTSPLPVAPMIANNAVLGSTDILLQNEILKPDDTDKLTTDNNCLQVNNKPNQIPTTPILVNTQLAMKFAEMERTLAMTKAENNNLLEQQLQARERELVLLQEEKRKRDDLERQLNEEINLREKIVEENIKLRDKKQTQARPLTRYLPVRDNNFDLKQHVENSGHHLMNQIDPNTKQPLIYINNHSCRGYLLKMGQKFKTWNKRWFVFDRNKRTLCYYMDRHENKLRGSIYFQSINEVYVDHMRTIKSPDSKSTFVVKTFDRNFYFVAPSSELMRIWVDVIFTGAEGYLEFID